MPIVEVKGVTRDYHQGEITVKALRGVDLKVEQGEFTALMGASGSGKTTLLNMIGGLDHPTSGQVFIEGREITALSEAQRSDLRRDRLGFVFQAYNLIPVFSAYENAEFILMLRGTPAAERKQRVMDTLAAVGLQGLEHRRPNQLSGGQQQRVAIARAIAGRPALVLADEPTANLDSTTSQGLLDTMKALNKQHGITFLFSTHDPLVMEAASRVVRMQDGHVLSDEHK